ncbi:retbindin [Ambystoma mexicanum]|uniref:retbindin n=1 Tax=Ambystoma mexicanum TaxID=8296 RepID=UPI0037E9457D
MTPQRRALGAAWTITLLFALVKAQEDSCLTGGKHKSSPGPEPQLWECQMYSDNACCSADVAQELSKTPVSSVNDIHWNRCRSLSAPCEGFLKRIECFYRCSPHAARWPHPERPTAILGVPLCLHFCDEWYDACKEDLTCARNWVSDWQWGPDGNNCTGDCISYAQMYANGRELCENIWGDSFTAAQEPCQCLTLTDSDLVPRESLTEEGESAEEPDITKEGVSGDPGPCQGTRSPFLQKLQQASRHKRSVFIEDVEGSGSGF